MNLLKNFIRQCIVEAATSQKVIAEKALAKLRSYEDEPLMYATFAKSKDRAGFNPKTIDSNVAALWAFELQRGFGDELINSELGEWFTHDSPYIHVHRAKGQPLLVHKVTKKMKDDFIKKAIAATGRQPKVTRTHYQCEHIHLINPIRLSEYLRDWIIEAKRLKVDLSIFESVYMIIEQDKDNSTLSWVPQIVYPTLITS